MRSVNDFSFQNRLEVHFSIRGLKFFGNDSLIVLNRSNIISLVVDLISCLLNVQNFWWNFVYRLDKSLSIDLCSWDLYRNIGYNTLIIDNGISDDLFGINWSLSFLLSDNWSLNYLLFNNRLRNEFSMNNWLRNYFLFHLFVVFNFLCLLNLRFRVINLFSVNFIDNSIIIHPLFFFSSSSS